MAALAWDSERKRRDAESCPGCGGHLPETTDPEAEGMYEAQVVRCHRCKARNRAAQRLGDDMDRSSLLIYTVKESEHG